MTIFMTTIYYLIAQLDFRHTKYFVATQVNSVAIQLTILHREQEKRYFNVSDTRRALKHWNVTQPYSLVPSIVYHNLAQNNNNNKGI